MSLCKIHNVCIIIITQNWKYGSMSIPTTKCNLSYRYQYIHQLLGRTMCQFVNEGCDWLNDLFLYPCVNLHTFRFHYSPTHTALTSDNKNSLVDLEIFSDVGLIFAINYNCGSEVTTMYDKIVATCGCRITAYWYLPNKNYIRNSDFYNFVQGMSIIICRTIPIIHTTCFQKKLTVSIKISECSDQHTRVLYSWYLFLLGSSSSSTCCFRGLLYAFSTGEGVANTCMFLLTLGIAAVFQ